MSTPLPGIGMDNSISQMLAAAALKAKSTCRGCSPSLMPIQRYTPTQLRHGTVTQIQDSLGAALGFAGSAISGNVKTIAVGLYEEME